MKKLINAPKDAVQEMLQGLVALHPGLALLADCHVLLRADAEQVRNRQVALISGGGSGHEPAHGGYVGAGMLSAAVAGEVFTSPSAGSVLAAIQAVAGERGVLLIVKNYTGDRLNFGLAAEMARANGISVEMVVVADDVALAGTTEYAGARGIAGTVFVHKVAGWAAAEGKSLREVAAIAQETANAIATMGVALSAGTAPGGENPSFLLGEGEVELGLGIHGEPGIRRVPLAGADDLAKELVDSILAKQQWMANEPIAVLINNLGATTAMELAIVARAAIGLLESRGLLIQRVYAGSFMTSLDAAGVSISVLRLNEDRLRGLDSPTSAPAWPNCTAAWASRPHTRVLQSKRTAPAPHVERAHRQLNRLQRIIQAACRAVVDSEKQLTELDRLAGDGDLGVNLARGARAVEESLPEFSSLSPVEVLKAIGLTVQNTIGGSSGALYGVFFLRAATALRAAHTSDPKTWAQACLEACDAVSNLGDAKEGDRTMLDALLPFAKDFADRLAQGHPTVDALEAAVVAGEKGAEATANMLPRRGRSSYLGKRVLDHPDPGAVAAALWLRAAVLASS